MTGQIYVIDTEQQLLAMHKAPHDSEDLLQRLLADHSSLLAGNQ